MAYSDYGGRVYRDGERREDRCDAVLTPEGIQSTPGQWPGWTISEGRSGNSYHALLGDGPIFVGLYKQSSVTVHRLGDELDFPGFGDRGDGVQSVTFEVDGHRIEAELTEEDNYYVYVRLTQPDGTVWTGWSGYGVGAGLEDAGYGFSSEDRDAMMAAIFSPLPAAQGGR